jgi:hypothetical protein
VPGTIAVLRPAPDQRINAVGWREVPHLVWFVAAVIVTYHLR